MKRRAGKKNEKGMNQVKLSRRGFLKIGAAGAAAMSMPGKLFEIKQTNFPDGEYLGRVNVGKVDLKIRPDINSQTVGALYEDAVIEWLREVVGSNPFRMNQRWVETPDGYIWSPYLQPVRNIINQPLENLPKIGSEPGMWAEVTVPWVDIILDNPPARSPGLKDNPHPRLYFSQILWVDQISTDSEGGKWYRINERYGSYGDILLAKASAFRPIEPKEIEAIHPEVENKRVIIDVTYQTMSCYEENEEVYFCRISTGAKYNAEGESVDKWATPIGAHPVWRKLISLHMSGGTTGGGYDLPGIGWSSLFVGNGVAIHSTFWHNNFGVPMSHGCVNTKPDDAKWVFRWIAPEVPYDPGDITIPMPGGTKVEVIES